MADLQSIRRSPTADMGIPNALVETPDLGRAGASNLFRSRSPPGTRSADESKATRRKHRAGTRERLGLGRMLRRSARDRVAELLA